MNGLLTGLAVVVCMFCGCAVSGSIVDRGSFETKLTRIRLEKRPGLRIYYGGSKRELKLNLINTIIVDPAVTLTVDGELYFSADITLKDGTRISSMDKDDTRETRAFLSVQDALIGSNDKDAFKIGLDNVSRFTIR